MHQGGGQPDRAATPFSSSSSNSNSGSRPGSGSNSSSGSSSDANASSGVEFEFAGVLARFRWGSAPASSPPARPPPVRPPLPGAPAQGWPSRRPPPGSTNYTFAAPSKNVRRVCAAMRPKLHNRSIRQGTCGDFGSHSDPNSTVVVPRPTVRRVCAADSRARRPGPPLNRRFPHPPRPAHVRRRSPIAAGKSRRPPSSRRDPNHRSSFRSIAPSPPTVPERPAGGSRSAPPVLKEAGERPRRAPQSPKSPTGRPRRAPQSPESPATGLGAPPVPGEAGGWVPVSALLRPRAQPLMIGPKSRLCSTERSEGVRRDFAGRSSGEASRKAAPGRERDPPVGRAPYAFAP